MLKLVTLCSFPSLVYVAKSTVIPSSFADYLNRKEILTVRDLNDYLSEAYKEASAIRKSVKAMEQRARVIAGIRKAYGDCRETKEIHDQYGKIGWKGRKEKFRRNTQRKSPGLRKPAVFSGRTCRMGR